MPESPDLSTAEQTPSESWVTASDVWLNDESRWQKHFFRAEATDGHEIGLYARTGSNDNGTAYFDPVAAVLLAEQLIQAARNAIVKRHPITDG